MGQLPMERVTPDVVFNKISVDYAGPVYIKRGAARKPTILKAYICIFVSLSVKAVHLELVSDLTAEAFLACLRRFIARRGKPTLILSDYGTNFVGVMRLLREFFEFLRQQVTEKAISDFCGNSSQNEHHILVVYGRLQSRALRSTYPALLAMSSSPSRR